MSLGADWLYLEVFYSHLIMIIRDSYAETGDCRAQATRHTAYQGEVGARNFGQTCSIVEARPLCARAYEAPTPVEQHQIRNYIHSTDYRRAVRF